MSGTARCTSKSLMRTTGSSRGSRTPWDRTDSSKESGSMSDLADQAAKLRALVGGDLAALSEVRGWTHEHLEGVASGIDLVVTADAVRRVLNAFLLEAPVQ